MPRIDLPFVIGSGRSSITNGKWGGGRPAGPTSRPGPLTYTTRTLRIRSREAHPHEPESDAISGVTQSRHGTRGRTDGRTDGGARFARLGRTDGGARFARLGRDMRINVSPRISQGVGPASVLVLLCLTFVCPRTSFSNWSPPFIIDNCGKCYSMLRTRGG